MVELVTLSIAGMVVSELLKWVMQATKSCLTLQQVLQGSSHPS
jgi:hypothetical protein